MYGFGLAFINGLFKGRLGMVGIYKCGIMSTHYELVLISTIFTARALHTLGVGVLDWQRCLGWQA